MTKYSGLNTVAKYMNRQNIIRSIRTSYPTVWHNATKFGVNQEAAGKEFITTKRGANSYHPLLVFENEMKLLYHTWFRTGSTYTASGVVEFLKEAQSSLPWNIRKVFFRTDSGFFSGNLFDLLESYSWDYLVKVKLKNLESLLKAQDWTDVEDT